VLPVVACPRSWDHRVLITCNEDDIAPACILERNGGVLEDVRDTELGRTRRYWIDLPLDQVR
jgi:predicted acetyltransferase